MRFHFWHAIERLHSDLLRVLILMAFVACCPPSAHHFETKAMHLNDTATPTKSSSAGPNTAPSIPAALTTAAVAADSAIPAKITSSSIPLLPTSDNFNDSNEIDSTDYVMTKHIASSPSHAGAVTHPASPNKALDLSSLSLLSSNDTTATAKQRLNDSHGHSHSHGHSYSHNATFQHIGSQRIALKAAAAPATAATTSATGTATATAAAGSGKSNSIRTSAKKVESKYVLPKPQKTDAPMLNYIFDTFSSANKHHHHDQRYGPHFEDVQRVGQPTNMTVQAGSSIHLNCRISLLQDKTVSWVRRNALSEENALDLLTVGLHTYTGDKRYKMEFQYPNNWRLKITNVKKDDEAMYECQISTHPPRVIQINLLVNAPKVMIVDEFGDPLQEKYYEIDSTLQLACVVRNVAMATSVVYWKHADDVLNYDVTRGGISVKTELMDDGANSTLSIAKISKADSGNYTCSISDFQNFSIVVHILNGESFAELHHGGAPSAHLTCRCHHMLGTNLVLLLLLLLCLPEYVHR